jgi:hypothetical protein
MILNGCEVTDCWRTSLGFRAFGSNTGPYLDQAHSNGNRLLLSSHLPLVGALLHSQGTWRKPITVTHHRCIILESFTLLDCARPTAHAALAQWHAQNHDHVADAVCDRSWPEEVDLISACTTLSSLQLGIRQRYAIRGNLFCRGDSTDRSENSRAVI